MKLTKEQENIVRSTGNIKINAVAGSGKTTTIIEYAKRRPKQAKILYLAFNKSVKLEAVKKFSEKGLANVTIETAHSLAFRHVVSYGNYRVRSHAYKPHEIVDLLKIRGNGEKHAEYIIAAHINKFVSYFCNSNKKKVQQLNYLDIVHDKKARAFVKALYKDIEWGTRLLLSKMDKGEIEITHDFYLKKFQLSNPRLPFDYILFDEGQDASPAMLDVFFNQHATKVIVGDTHQQIYGWRHAVNSLEKAEFRDYYLSTSFRFNQEIADLAVKVIEWKRYLYPDVDMSITGKGSSPKNKTKATIARTNLGLLLKAIEYVTKKRPSGKIYFEGNINSYTYAEDGASLYDVLNLLNGKKRLIRDKLIQQMGSLAELSEYIEKTNDVQLSTMVEIVNEYGNSIPDILKEIKGKHISSDNKNDADMIFSTVHKSKGMEYGSVNIVNDYITEEKLEKINGDNNAGIQDAKINEEINLLYVAVTRAKNKVCIPEELLPKGYEPASTVEVVQGSTGKDTAPKENTKASAVNNVLEKHKGAYKPWTHELDEELTVMFNKGVKVPEMALHFERTRGGIRSRIKKLQLKERYG